MNPIGNDDNNIRKVLRYFSEGCKLDVFMHLCMLDYVGHDQVDTLLNVQEICRKISFIKQVWNTGCRLLTDTPYELFDKFTRLTGCCHYLVNIIMLLLLISIDKGPIGKNYVRYDVYDAKCDYLNH